MSQDPGNENIADAATSQPSTSRLKSPHTYAELRPFRLQNLVITPNNREQPRVGERLTNTCDPIEAIKESLEKPVGTSDFASALYAFFFEEIVDVKSGFCRGSGWPLATPKRIEKNISNNT
ncbi:unnamed protein product [Cylicocyclus nassatus]|uniref:Uncharacterized protein n=1 Tax=Cylicocyclus nassatus TaxID=53992 RepID=A0AA36GYF2_CYLNA|nr:unnamed protein product [Cylicocyclus nassatus]